MVAKRKPESADPKAATVQTPTGKRAEPVPSWPKASPDDPIFSRGYVIGMTYSGRASTATTKPEPQKAKRPEK
jgi:hypothetical protein